MIVQYFPFTFAKYLLRGGIEVWFLFDLEMTKSQENEKDLNLETYCKNNMTSKEKL